MLRYRVPRRIGAKFNAIAIGSENGAPGLRASNRRGRLRPRLVMHNAYLGVSASAAVPLAHSQYA